MRRIAASPAMTAAAEAAPPAAAGPPPLPHSDPTVASPEELALVQASLGISFQDTDPALLKHIVDRSRVAGNEAFRQKSYKEAVRMYTQAIAGDPSDAALFANRSAAYLSLGLYEQAAWDGRKAASLKPGWAKGHYRLGCALLALSSWGEAVSALEAAAQLEPGSSEVGAKLALARGRAEAEVAARRAQAAAERRAVTDKLRAARRADHELTMLNQFKQSMAGPDWDLEDLEWRPTFLPAMRLKPQDPAKALADHRARLLVGYLNALADLAAPKHALRTLGDLPRLQAFQRGFAAALASQPPGAHALVLGSGGGLLALLAAEAGADRVTAVERSRMLYRMAKQVLESNTGGEAGRTAGSGGGSTASLPDEPAAAEAEPSGDNTSDASSSSKAAAAAKVCLLDRRLQSVGVRGEAPPPDALLAAQERSVAIAAASAAGIAIPGGQEEEEDVAAMLPGRASLLVTDLLDHSVLGLGLLPALDYAAERLLAPGALIVPQAVDVYAALLELRVERASGFDLSALNAYWWHPSAGERLDLERLPHRALSAPFRLSRLDLQARVDAKLAALGRAGNGAANGTDSSSGGEEDGAEDEEEGKHSSAAAWELDASLEVPVTADGQWNAVLVWFEVHAGHGSGAVVASWAAPAGAEGNSSGDASGSAAGPAASGTAAEAPAAAAGEEAAAPASPPEVATSWGPAVHYVDSQAVKKGASVRLRVRQDGGQFVLTSTPPQCRPRHALVPRWHFDMVLDSQRNEAYNAAIRRAVAAKRAAGCEHLLALDLGAGTGLLAMMAARAGADEVFGVEMSPHMTDVGEETVIANGFLGRVTMMDRDARRLDVVRKPDGTPPDLPRRADLLVYEVFDSGCIGEGVLHILAAAQLRLLAPDAAMVPQAARVWCQPLQMRAGRVLGWDVSQANRWRWRPDYEGVELGKCRDEWVPLAPPQLAFSFDFTRALSHMRPEEAVLGLAFDREGVFNAVATWFELDLDEECTLSTSPYSDKGLTWQQAVQWVPEVAVTPGQALLLTARHDTYSISYSHELEAPAGQQGGSSVPGTVLPAGQGSPASSSTVGAAAPPSGPAAPATPAPASEAALLAAAAETVGSSGGQLAASARRPQRTDVPLMDPAWQAAYERLQGLNAQLAKSCVQNPLEYRAVAQAALALATRPHDLGVDAQQAAEFCVRMLG